MRPKIPADLNALGIPELAQLSNQYREWIVAQAATNPTGDDLTDVLAAGEERKTVQAMLRDKKALAALAAEGEDEVDEAPDQTITPPSNEPLEGEPGVDPAPPPGTPAPTGTAPAAPVVEGDGQANIRVTVPTTTGGNSVPAAPAPQRTTLAGMVGRGGKSYASWSELASDLTDRADNLGDPATKERFTVAQVRGNYDALRTIPESDEYLAALPKFDRSEEITAALCAPATPYYGLSCNNTDRRPVFNSMGQFAAPRGKVSIPTSPTLADITGQNAGYGQWTFANDDDGSRKNCAVVACNSFNDFQLYGIWKCLTVKNLMALTYPELVEAYLNRLGAAQSRMAEILLLEAMATGTTAVQGPALGYGTVTSFTTLVLEYFALYQEQQRWDITGGMKAWMPRWVQTAMKVDILRRRQTNGQVPAVPTDAAIDTMLGNVGVNPTWFIDTPSWAPAIPSVQTGGNMNRLPTTIPVILAPAGKFAVIDRGQLNIGVTGNNIYRDNSSNATNTYTYFVESFEGLVNTDSCPAHLLRLPVCHNGVQVDDRLVDCLGLDELGWQS